MQVIQATQVPTLPTRDPAHPGAAVSYAAIDGHALLREDAPTVVRVWGGSSCSASRRRTSRWCFRRSCTAWAGNWSRSTAARSCRRASRPRDRPGPDAPTTADEGSETAAYTFMLPPSWTETGVPIELHAVLMPTQTGGPPGLRRSEGKHPHDRRSDRVRRHFGQRRPARPPRRCSDRRYVQRFFSDVQFFHSRTVTIIPVELRKNDVPLLDPELGLRSTKISNT